MEAKLVVTGGKASMKEVQLKLPTVVGRGKEADLTIAHPTVSRRHCEIAEEDGKLVVRDFKSLNGTFVGKQKIDGQIVLQPGDELTIGPLTFKAVYEVLAAAASATGAAGPAAAKSKLPSDDFDLPIDFDDDESATLTPSAAKVELPSEDFDRTQEFIPGLPRQDEADEFDALDLFGDDDSAAPPPAAVAAAPAAPEQSDEVDPFALGIDADAVDAPEFLFGAGDAQVVSSPAESEDIPSEELAFSPELPVESRPEEVAFSPFDTEPESAAVSEPVPVEDLAPETPPAAEPEQEPVAAAEPTDPFMAEDAAAETVEDGAFNFLGAVDATQPEEEADAFDFLGGETSAKAAPEAVNVVDEIDMADEVDVVDAIDEVGVEPAPAEPFVQAAADAQTSEPEEAESFDFLSGSTPAAAALPAAGDTAADLDDEASPIDVLPSPALPPSSKTASNAGKTSTKKGWWPFGGKQADKSKKPGAAAAKAPAIEPPAAEQSEPGPVFDASDEAADQAPAETVPSFADPADNELDATVSFSSISEATLAKSAAPEAQTPKAPETPKIDVPEPVADQVDDDPLGDIDFSDDSTPADADVVKIEDRSGSKSDKKDDPDLDDFLRDLGLN